MPRAKTNKHKFLDRSRSKECLACGQTFFRDNRCTRKYWEKARFCSRECFGANYKATASKRRPKIEDAFWSKVSKGNDCWVWGGCKDKDGYGIFFYGGKRIRANRVALELSGLELPPGHFACHRCDNPACVRPDHLFPGSPQENSDDAVSKGRVCNGENVHCAKLNERSVKTIRSDVRPVAEIASEYGVSQSSIYQIKSRKTWNHV